MGDLHGQPPAGTAAPAMTEPAVASPGSGSMAAAPNDAASPGVPSVGPVATTLRLEPSVPARAMPDRRVVVLDPTWTPPAGDPSAPTSVRDVAATVLMARDPIAETADLLDAWAIASGVVEALTVDGTSYWYYGRLNHWIWLQTRLIWLAIVDALVRAAPTSRIECAPGADPELLAAVADIAARDGLEIAIEAERKEPVAAARAFAASAVARPGSPVARAVRLARRIAAGVRRRVDRVIGPRLEERRIARRQRAVQARFDALANEPGRLLVLLQHAEQDVVIDGLTRRMNAYLGPIADRLRGTRLEPIELDIRARVASDAGWARFGATDHPRLLTADVLASAPGDAIADNGATAPAAIAAIREAPVLVSGVDLGPALRTRVVEATATSLETLLRNRDRARWLLRRLRPAGVLLADEYHRQDWTAAAAAEGIPTVAVQHGMIYRHHNGYMHRVRPATLRVPDRTYVFGRWERDLLVERSVYRPDEVSVGGSPRLDLLTPERGDRAAVRSELGVRPDERLVVVSGTWGSIYRSFHYPICLAGLVDRPLPGIHLVIKQHPGERDEGPYRAVLEGAAAARGLPPPRVTVVQHVDLYRVLAAADAHLGVHSTVLTEAVVTGTPNLLADSLAAADLLGYVPAGVAVPVRDGGDLLAALDAAAVGTSMPEAARAAFLAAHYEPGDASERISRELLAWLP